MTHQWKVFHERKSGEQGQRLAEVVWPNTRACEKQSQIMTWTHNFVLWCMFYKYTPQGHITRRLSTLCLYTKVIYSTVALESSSTRHRRILGKVVITLNLAAFVFQLQVSPGNFSDSSSLLATISQHELGGPPPTVAYIAEQQNTTRVTIATVLDQTSHRRSFSNQTALFEKNTLSQQDQCWETYVGQVVTQHACEGLGC